MLKPTHLSFKSIVIHMMTHNFCARFATNHIWSTLISLWFGSCSASDKRSVQSEVRTAEKIIGHHTFSLEHWTKTLPVQSPPHHPRPLSVLAPSSTYIHGVYAKGQKYIKCGIQSIRSCRILTFFFFTVFSFASVDSCCFESMYVSWCFLNN